MAQPWRDDQPLVSLAGDPWRIRDACEGTAIFGGTGSGKTESFMLPILATIANERGDYEGARRRFVEMGAGARADGNEELEAVAEGNIANMLIKLGEPSEAMTLLAEQVRRVRATPLLKDLAASDPEPRVRDAALELLKGKS